MRQASVVAIITPLKKLCNIVLRADATKGCNIVLRAATKGCNIVY